MSSPASAAAARRTAATGTPSAKAAAGSAGASRGKASEEPAATAVAAVVVTAVVTVAVSTESGAEKAAVGMVALRLAVGKGFKQLADQIPLHEAGAAGGSGIIGILTAAKDVEAAMGLGGTPLFQETQHHDHQYGDQYDTAQADASTLALGAIASTVAALI